MDGGLFGLQSNAKICKWSVPGRSGSRQRPGTPWSASVEGKTGAVRSGDRTREWSGRRDGRDGSFGFYYEKDERPLERLSVGCGWGAFDEKSSISFCLSFLIASMNSCGHTTMTGKYISQS